jgi:peptidoglycan hydrolase FlgJ
MTTNSSAISALGADGIASFQAQQAAASRKLPSMGAASTPEDALKVGRQFESMFLSQMLQPMFAGIKTDGPFGGGHGEEAFRSLQIDEYAKGLTAAGGVGIAAAVQREILRMQEQAHAPAAG